MLKEQKKSKIKIYDLSKQLQIQKSSSIANKKHIQDFT